MAGFDNDVVFAKNADFTQAAGNSGSESNGLVTDGQLWIGTTAVNAGGTHINVGALTSPDGSVVIGYSTPNITLESGSAVPTTFQEDSGVAVPVANILNIFGGTTSAGTTPVSTLGAGNTVTIRSQISQALAATDATKIGLANFNSAQFTVDANGFVSTSGTGIGNTITGDSGGALSPTAGNWNILGRSGSKTSGSGSTLTVNSPPFSQVGSSATSSLNTGEFVTAAVTRTLPATAGLVDGDLVIYYCTTANALIVTANTGQTIRVGTLVSSSAGTATSTAIGDTLTLRFDATAVSWRAVSVIGTWLIA
jgi:hypothetical protein